MTSTPPLSGIEITEVENLEKEKKKEEAHASSKKRKQDFAEAMQDLRAINFDSVIEKFAKAGRGYEDVVDYMGDHISHQAETLVIRKVIECVLAKHPEAYVRVAFPGGAENSGDTTRDVDKAIAELRNCDCEAILKCFIPGLGIRNVLFVWDNEPFEVISDYDLKLKAIIQPAVDFADSLQGTVSEYRQSNAWRKVRINKLGFPENFLHKV